MNTNKDSSMKKLLKQVGNIVAVQAIAGAATELGKAVWPKLKEKLNAVLDKANEIHKAKGVRKDLSDLVRNSTSFYKKAREAPEPTLPQDNSTEKPIDPAVDTQLIS